MFGDTIYAYLLESIVVLIPMALIIFVVLKWVSGSSHDSNWICEA